MLKDVFDQELNEGDAVAFALAGRGAKPFKIGIVIRCMPKSVEIRYPYSEGNETNCIRTANSVVKGG